MWFIWLLYCHFLPKYNTICHLRNIPPLKRPLCCPQDSSCPQTKCLYFWEKWTQLVIHMIYMAFILPFLPKYTTNCHLCSIPPLQRPLCCPKASFCPQSKCLLFHYFISVKWTQLVILVIYMAFILPFLTNHTLCHLCNIPPLARPLCSPQASSCPQSKWVNECYSSTGKVKTSKAYWWHGNSPSSVQGLSLLSVFLVEAVQIKKCGDHSYSKDP
jgi:hypothetical protein